MREFFIPTRRTEVLFLLILVIVFLASLVNFPVSDFLNSEDSQIAFRVGWPLSFFQVTLENFDKMPFIFVNLIEDILLYLVIAYLGDIIFGVILFFINQPIRKPSAREPKEEVVDAYARAREAYSYYKRQGIEEKKVVEMFKERGWKEEDVKKLSR